MVLSPLSARPLDFFKLKISTDYATTHLIFEAARAGEGRIGFTKVTRGFLRGNDAQVCR
jgi:hypothetical protein